MNMNGSVLFCMATLKLKARNWCRRVGGRVEPFAGRL